MMDRGKYTSFSQALVIQNIEALDINVETAELLSELKRPKTLSVMACGLTGSGKSTLLNGLCGEEAFEVGHLNPETVCVDCHKIEKDNCTLNLYDTPGFEDDLGNEDAYLKEIKEKCSDIDTLFYCISLNATRIKMKDDLATLEKLYEALDKKIWGHCVIVLTFANTLIDRINIAGKTPPDKVGDEYKERVKAWEEKVRETFKKAGIEDPDIPLVYAGGPNIPKIFKSDPRPWLSILWETVSNISPPDCRCVLFHTNINRIFGLEDTDGPIHKQTLNIDKNAYFEKFKAKYPVLAEELTKGARAGATVGAVAAGIPTLALGVGPGILFGGLVGGLIGLSVGGFRQRISEKYKA